MSKQHVAICEKVALTIEEAAEYSNIGQNRISGLLKEPRCPFVLRRHEKTCKEKRI